MALILRNLEEYRFCLNHESLAGATPAAPDEFYGTKHILFLLLGGGGSVLAAAPIELKMDERSAAM